MSPMNFSKLLVPGLVAGLVINVSEFCLNTFVVGKDMMAATAKLGLPPIGGSAVIVFVLFGFALGLILAWLYAAARPRLGPGPRTATAVGFVLWFLAYLYGSVGFVMMGIFPMPMMVTAAVWGLVEVIVAANVAGYLYKEPA